MARYRKVDPRIWNDEKFLSLSDDGKLCFLFVLTHPHMTALGAMRGTIPGLAAEIRWKTERLRKAFGEVFRKALFEHDEGASFIALPNFLKYNRPENPNVVKSWRESLDLIPECSLKSKLVQRVKAFVEGLPKAFGEALPEVFRKGMPIQEQEQEQEVIEDSDVCIDTAQRDLFSSQERKAFRAPTKNEIDEFCKTKNIVVDADEFIEYYGSQGWKLSNGNPMKDWGLAVLRWHRTHNKQQNGRQGPGQSHPEDQKRVPGKL